LDAKVCLVTGATSGIGRATAEAFARDGLQVVMVSRDMARGEAARSEVVSKTRNQSVEVMVADLSSLESVRRLAAGFESEGRRLDIMINDAAVFTPQRQVTPEGLELMLATNFLGPFLLTRLLLPRLRASSPSRIINVTAPSTTRPDLEDLQGAKKFGALNAFGASKAADLLFTYALARRVGGGVTVNAYHPGIVKTNLMRQAAAPVRFMTSLVALFAGATPERAAQGIVQLATSDRFAMTTGKLVRNDKEISAPFIDDAELQDSLWRAASRLVGLPENL